MNHYQSILIAVDFSEHSYAALARGVQLAKRYNSPVHVIHVVDIPTYPVLEDVAVMGLPGVWDPELTEPLKNKSMQRLNAMLLSFELSETQGTLLIGNAETEILDFSLKIKADLIVMGKHGASGWRRLLGSTTDSVLHQSECDVLAINLDKA